MNDHPAAASGAKREKLHVLPYDLVPFQEMTEAYVRVAEFGAKKYDPWNWSKGLSRVQILGSLLRHTFAYLRGEETDKDSGLSHTDHILWNAAALAHNVRWNLEDGRRVEPLRGYKQAEAPVVIDIRAVMMEQLEKAADESPWVPIEYTMSEVVSDCCSFLTQPRSDGDDIYLYRANADGTVTKVRIDPDEPIVDQVREIVSATDARIEDRDALAAYIRVRQGNGQLKKASVVRVFEEFGLDKISDARPDQIRPLFAALQAAENHDQ